MSTALFRRVEQAPNVIDDFPVRPRDIEIEPVCSLALNVAKERLAVTSCLHHVAHCIPSEERVELSH